MDLAAESPDKQTDHWKQQASSVSGELRVVLGHWHLSGANGAGLALSSQERRHRSETHRTMDSALQQ